MSKVLIGRNPAATSTPEFARLWNDAVATFPELVEESREELLPRTPRSAPCRICGRMAELTREHVPPRAAFNKGAGRMHTLDHYLQRIEAPGGEVQQGGIWGYTLCESCNNLTGRLYAPEYAKWAITAFSALANAKVNVRELEKLEHQPRGRFGMGGTPGPRPGAFVREALAIMCSLSANVDLTHRFPAIRRIILDQSLEPMPEGTSIGLGLYLSDKAKISGPAGQFQMDTKTWRVTTEIALPPFILTMVLGGTDRKVHAFDLSAFTEIGPTEEVAVDSDVEIGLGATAYPSDMRTPAMVEAEATRSV